MTTKKSKRDLELENAELRGRVKALEEICAAYRAERAPAPTVNPMPFIPYVPPPAAAPFRLGEVWCGNIAPGGAAGNACAVPAFDPRTSFVAEFRGGVRASGSH